MNTRDKSCDEDLMYVVNSNEIDGIKNENEKLRQDVASLEKRLTAAAAQIAEQTTLLDAANAQLNKKKLTTQVAYRYALSCYASKNFKNKSDIPQITTPLPSPR
jgi:septal ring factor EnvC (AmiA/AmiB activator)